MAARLACQRHAPHGLIHRRRLRKFPGNLACNSCALRHSASRIARPVPGSALGTAPGEEWLGLRASAVQHRGVQSRRGTNHNCSGTSERGDDEYRGGWRGRGDRCTLICVRRRGRVSVRWTMGRVGEEHGGDGSLGAEWRPRGAGNVSPLDVPQRCGGLVAESDG
jgi:hypothetical protein